MVVLILVLLLAVMVGLIGWVAGLLRQARRSASRVSRTSATEVLPPPMVDLEQLTTWVLGHLPGTVAGTLGAEDIRRIVEWNLDFIRSKRAATNGHASKPAKQVIVAGAETAEYVLQQASAHGLQYTPEQVHAVLDAQMAFLESIGAAGPEIESP